MNAALKKDNQVVTSLEKRYLKNRFGNTYVALQEMNFLWSKEEVFDFDCQWREGKTLEEIATYFDRPQEEVLLLALDRALAEEIEPRMGGLIGETL
ncbi:hypothetical protein [Lederbergia lenta]|uniref:hypothetical protein n=1 Tax=Lederbergia lenta TaxID=1467 RepID=UPI00203CFEAC|nr:hypothetical protein [Lederbergia lenta]MCM3110652.1 hypothetical protein [Lederbergia lenta]